MGGGGRWGEGGQKIVSRTVCSTVQYSPMGKSIHCNTCGEPNLPSPPDKTLIFLDFFLVLSLHLSPTLSISFPFF